MHKVDKMQADQGISHAITLLVSLNDTFTFNPYTLRLLILKAYHIK